MLKQTISPLNKLKTFNFIKITTKVVKVLENRASCAYFFKMRAIIHLLISAQILCWVAAMSFAFLATDFEALRVAMKGYIYLFVFAMILCFIPSMRYARRYDWQPFALLLSLLPLAILFSAAALEFFI